jgi:multidrug efflux pump subunit AcrA (membrane-fusion protein)
MPVIPKTAVVTREGKSIAFVVAGGRLEQRIVQVGEPAGDDVAIARGIAIGESVVITPSDKLRNGVRVAAN